MAQHEAAWQGGLADRYLNLPCPSAPALPPLLQLVAQGALQQALGALSTTIFANRKSGAWPGLPP